MTTPTEWDEAQLLNADGRLDRLLPQRRLPIPGEVRARGGSVPLLVWKDQPDQAAAFVAPPPNLLTNFVNLRNASPEKIAAFARKWGALVVCHMHPRYPAYHGLNLDCGPGRLADPQTSPMFPWDVDEPNDDPAIAGWFWEPVEAWQKWASEAHNIIGLAAKTHLGRQVDAKSLGWLEAGHGDLLSPFREKPTIVSPLRGKVTIEHQQMIVTQLVERWRRMGSVQPFFEWRGGKTSITLGGAGLFGALATQLIFAVSRAVGLDVCSNCGELYSSRRRKAASRRHYCPKCGRRAALRDAQWDLRLKRKALALHREGVPAEEISDHIRVEQNKIAAWIRSTRSNAAAAAERA